MANIIVAQLLYLDAVDPTKVCCVSCYRKFWSLYKVRCDGCNVSHFLLYYTSCSILTLLVYIMMLSLCEKWLTLEFKTNTFR